MICAGVLLSLFFVGHMFFSERAGPIPIEEVKLNEVAATPFTEAVETDSSEVVVASPAAIEIVELVTPELVEPECIIIDDFAEGIPKLQWYTVNDGVMGGLSQGAASLDQDVLVHSGVLNTNGGGFSYVGARLPANILTGYTRLQVRMNTYGRQYSVNFGDSRNRRISHQALIPLGSVDFWQEVLIDFDQTVPTIFSRQVNGAPFATSAIEELSFILGDGINGPFRMEIDWIKACI